MRIGRTALMVVATLLAALSLGLLAGCGDDDDDGADATTTEQATTEAPATTAQTEPTETAAETDAAEGDVAAGQQFFSQTCTGCHMNDGRDAGGPGPILAGQGLTPEVIEETVENGKGAMPPGLAQGEDLENVVAYVTSLQ